MTGTAEDLPGGIRSSPSTSWPTKGEPRAATTGEHRMRDVMEKTAEGWRFTSQGDSHTGAWSNTEPR